MSDQRYGAVTHVGCVREHNEDSFSADPAAGLWLLADGMGGRQAGEVASRIVVETIGAAVADGKSLVEAIAQADQAVLAAASAEQAGMGSTVVALKLVGDAYEIAWVGDSRAYLWRSGATGLHLLTRDHSFVQRLLEAGLINTQEAKVHPARNRLTQALGPTQETHLAKVPTVSGRLQPDELLLLCSDGLTGALDDEQIAAVLARPGSLQERVDQLIQVALTQGASDNITVLLVAAPVDPPQADERPGSPAVKVAGGPMTSQPATRAASPHRRIQWRLVLWLIVAMVVGCLVVWGYLTWSFIDQVDRLLTGVGGS